MKIFLGLTEISGFYSELYFKLLDHGETVDYHCIFGHKYEYRAKNKSKLTELLKIYYTKTKNFPFLIKLLLYPFYFFLRFLYLISCLIKYDIFIFGFGNSLLPLNLDLFLLKIFKKKVVSFLFHGSEVRPPFMDGSYNWLEMRDLEFRLKMITYTLKNLYKAKVFERYSTIIISNPNNFHFFSKDVINYYSLGQFSYQNQNPYSCKNRIVKILHAPSNFKSKGSDKILQILEELIQEGFSLEVELLQNKKNDFVINEIKNSDLIVDQLYSDVLCPGFAYEAISCNKPVVVCGHELEKLKSYFISKGIEIPPVINLLPQNLKSFIRDVLINPEILIDKEKEIISKKSNNNDFTINLLSIIKNNITKDNYKIDKDFEFNFGFGLDKTDFFRIQKRIHDLGIWPVYYSINNSGIRKKLISRDRFDKRYL